MVRELVGALFELTIRDRLVAVDGGNAGRCSSGGMSEPLVQAKDTAEGEVIPRSTSNF